MKRFGLWELECQLRDGGRISRLRYAGVDLLTQAPPRFRAPAGRYGRYESRPVYGYDDCFPTVDPCDDWPDHGELCWLPWEGSQTDCSVRSRLAPLTFSRRLQFSGRELLWSFSAVNHGGGFQPVQHVMHPLMPPADIAEIELPRCPSRDTAELARNLVQLPQGTAEMIFLNGISDGRFALRWRKGLCLTVTFSREQFPTLGIWWNNGGYPDPDGGLTRQEFAIEPTPGLSSRLADGATMRLAPHGRLDWKVRWEMEQCVAAGTA